MPFRFFDHTGDIGLELTAPDLAGLFGAASDAFSDILTRIEAIERRMSQSISLEAASIELLLVDWVSELVYRFDAFEWLTREAEVRVGSHGDAWLLSATLHGEMRQAERHPLKVLVKAVTYHELAVEEAVDGWRARLVLDI